MSDRVEQFKKLIFSMTEQEIQEANEWIYEWFKTNAEDPNQTWDEAVEAAMSPLKALGSKLN